MCIRDRLYTADIAKVQEDGYFYIVDRNEVPGVAEAAVAGIPDEYRGETVCAFVVRKKGASLTEDEAIKFCRQEMVPYKVPRKVKFMDELPKTTVGKILRRKLAEQAMSPEEDLQT